MIKATELRIGNWCNYLGAPIQIINGVSIDKNYGSLNPIPLTPEILEKCGFDTDNDADEYGVPNAWLIVSTNFAEYDNEFSYFSKEKILKFGYYNRVKVESLHQLQNLYFALTGEELQVNL